MEDIMLMQLVAYLKTFIGFILIMYAAIKLKKNNKKVTSKILISFFLGFAIYVMPLNLVKVFFTIPEIWIGIIVLIITMFFKMKIKVRNYNYKVEVNDDIDILKRAIDFEYNPSIIGFLFKHKLELKDLSADILNLYEKKIIEIKKDETGKKEMYIGEKYEEYKEKLQNSDCYIILYIQNKEWKFDFSMWKQMVKSTYEKLEFSHKKETINEKIFSRVILFIGIILFIIIEVIYKFGFWGSLFITLCILLPITLIAHIINLNIAARYMKLTEQGEKVIKDCIKLKKFMEEYTLLKDRTVEEVCVYESYIPYAVALGVNRKYEGAIFEIFDKELSNIFEDIDRFEMYK